MFEGSTTAVAETGEGSVNNAMNNQHKPSSLAGMPIGPTSGSLSTKPVIVRYMYEGGHIGQGRLCRLHPADASGGGVAAVAAPRVIRALRDDGVDFDKFYACAYESKLSTGGWMPLEPAPRHRNPWNDSGGSDGYASGDSPPAFEIPSAEDAMASRRIDIKLFRRPGAPSHVDAIQSLDDVLETICAQELNEKGEHSATSEQLSTDEDFLSASPIECSSDAHRAMLASVPLGKLPLDMGYFGVGIVNPKTSANVGTLWRSAYQLGASVLYTVGGRYKPGSADTLNVPARVPLIELDDWNGFVESAPKGAVWVAIETGGTPLSDFEHPRNAVYVLGSEDHGLPTSVLRGCREVVSIESESYGSYNVAVAGSIVMYDRLVKMRRAERRRKEGRKK